VSKIWGHKEGKPYKSNTSPVYWDAHTGTIDLNFGIRGDINDIITHVK